MPFVLVNEPTAIVYTTPEENSPIEDILRYGTVIHVSETRGNWVKDDLSQGWLPRNGLLEVDETPHARSNARVGLRGAYVFPIPDTRWGPCLHLPFETPIEVLEESPKQNGRWMQIRLQDGKKAFIQKSHLLFPPFKIPLGELAPFSKQFLGINYLWGGTSSFGYDCSGFVQMLFRQIGVPLPRNSYQQAEDPQLTDIPYLKRKEADLIFFSNETKQIVHVGMMLNAEEFIHAFTKEEAWICISSIRDERFKNGHFYHGIQLKRLKKPHPDE